MTDMKQPEALRLIAEWRNSMPIGVMRIWAADVRDELRRQHAEIESLRAKLDELEKQEPVAIAEGCDLMWIAGKQIATEINAFLYLAAGACPVELPFAIMDDELEALRRFDECVRDSDAGGYDVRNEMMKRLAEIGLVRRVTANIYEHTNFGLSVLNGDFDAAPTTQPAPAAQDDAKDAARWRYAVAIGENQAMNWLNVYNDWEGEGSFVDAIDAAREANMKEPT